MKITKISVSQTRQITQFHPANYSIEAELVEGEDSKKAIQDLHKMVFEELYKDVPEERDKLIARFCK